MCCVLWAAATAARAATDFSDHSGFSSASSTVNSRLKLGAVIDSETSITANSTATGDDNTGSDDEDGVTVPASMVTGTTTSLTVNVTNTTGSTAFLNAWIDYNRNGSLSDSGEQIAINTTITTGTSNANRTVNFTVPSGASLGTAGVRVRLTSTSSPGPTGLDGNGEVEDYITTLVCPTITLNTSSLPNGAVSWPYSQTLAASGGNGSYVWALTSGTLPAGLSLNASTGVISGTPTVSNAGGVNLTFTATDASGCQGSDTLLLQVLNFISISPTTLPPPTVGTAFSQTMTALESGFDVQQAFSSNSVGTLAAADAVLAGTNRIGNWTGTASTIAYNGSSAGGGHVTDTGFPGGSGDNFALKATGIITIPTAGAWTILTNSDDGVRVKIDGSTVINDDTLHATADRLGTVTLTAGIHVIELVFFELGGGEAIELFAASGTQNSYNSSFKLIGADDGLSVARTSPTFTWNVASGSLPSGLTLNASTGLISGTPTSSSTFTFTLRATDNLGYYGTQAYTVKPCSAITLSPSTLASSIVNSAYSQTVSASGGTSPYVFEVSSGALPAGLTLNTSTGVISGQPTSTTAASFTLAVTDANGCSALRAYSMTPASTDFGDNSDLGNASSTVLSTLKIGALTDAEATATTNGSATGDDITGSDDEDGVTVPASIMQGSSTTVTVNVTNTSGSSAFLNAWIDYNQNGLLTDSGEQIATNTVISNGTSNSNKTITFTVPNAATLGTTGLRVRLTSTSSPGSTGSSGNGEVEDYTVVVASSLAVGNLIWNDANENGLFDSGESGIDNVLVELWTAGADNDIGGTGSNADTKVSSVTSAGGGGYNFSGLSSGYYFVKVPTPPLSRTSLVVDTTDNGQDGDNNASQPGGSGTSAYSPVIRLISGTEPGTSGSGNYDNTVDFGFASNIGSPFLCDNRFWIVQNAETRSGSGVFDTTLYYVGDGPSLVPAFIFSGYKLNGLAAYGGYLYCVDQNGDHLYRINSQGVLVDMGAIPGLASPGSSGQWSGATALTNGLMILNLYNFSPSSTQLYTIDLTSASLVGAPITVTNTGTGTTYRGNFGDIVWDPLTSNVYGYSTVDTSWLGLFQINITTGAATRVSASAPGSWGSMIIDANGLTYGFGSAGSTGNQDTLYAFNRTSGVLNGSITAVGTGPAVSNSDGAACPGAAPSMKMGNLVWNDVDNDGIKDAAEAGIDGVTLQLFLGGQNPLTAAPAATTTTSGGGFYTFSNLSPGQYFIYMPTPPAGFPLSSSTTVTLDNGVDNDDNGIQTSQGLPVQSPLIGLAGGTESITDGDTDPNTNLSIDFGFLACPAITVNPSSIAAAAVGTAYTQTFTASGGTSPYIWTVSTGTLPAGLTLSTAGVLSGTPTSSAATSFTLRAADKNGCLGTRAYTLTPVCPTITVTPSSLPDAAVGTAYSQTFGASGGNTPYTWAVSSGTLPAGLTLSTAGVLSGTPTSGNAAGTNLTFTVTDKFGCQQSATLNLQVCPVVT
ncbi:putative Ig domain-containing protein, partial [Prosthecobacter sp.]|uniref:beta strand repeat-containing protein n=1 Tax=Prosthecobacter sp. TaxID=1965333 RepID=UPI00248A68B3